MAAVIVDIADMVVAKIAAATVPADLNQAVTAARTYLVRHELPDLTAVKIDVVPESRKNRVDGGGRAGGSRGRTFADFGIDLGIHKKVADDLDVHDDVMLLCDEIDALFRKQRHTTPDARSVVHVDTKFKAVFSPDHLETKRTLLVVMTLYFGVAF